MNKSIPESINLVVLMINRINCHNSFISINISRCCRNTNYLKVNCSYLSFPCSTKIFFSLSHFRCPCDTNSYLLIRSLREHGAM